MTREARDRTPHIRFETEVIGADWDDETAPGQVHTLAMRTAPRTLLPARAIISAVGQLNRPHTPDFKGMSTNFDGPQFHSSNWDHSVDYKGKKVALIGAGASGFQIVPTIAEDTARSAHRLPAHRAVDVPESELPRRSRRRRSLGTAPPAVLRPLVPLPDLLAVRWRRWTGRRPGRSGAGPTSRLAVSERNEMTRVRCSRSGSRARSAMTRSCWPRSFRTTRRPASAPCRTTAAGSRHSSATMWSSVRDEIDHIDAGGVVTVSGGALRG